MNTCPWCGGGTIWIDLAVCRCKEPCGESLCAALDPDAPMRSHP